MLCRNDFMSMMTLDRLGIMIIWRYPQSTFELRFYRSIILTKTINMLWSHEKKKMAKMGHIIAQIIIWPILRIMDMALVENKQLIIIQMVMKKYQQHQCRNHQSMIATMKMKVHYYHKAIQNIINNADPIQILDTLLQEQPQIRCK